MRQTPPFDLLVLAGSRAYGLATPESDYDYRGVFSFTPTELLGLGSPSGTFERLDQISDVVAHEAGKFVRLCLAANPTVLEVLALPIPTGQSPTQFGEALRNARTRFYSNRVRKTYGGYAFQQFTRLKGRGDSFSADTKKRSAKHARHLLRLVDQGSRLLQTGELVVEVDDPQRYFDFGELPFDEMLVQAERALARFDAVNSILPDEPDTDTIEEILLYHRYQTILQTPLTRSKRR